MANFIYKQHTTTYMYLPFCGCWYLSPKLSTKSYLPLVELESHTTILANTSRTVLRQTFNNSLKENLKEVSYTFPLYDGVSVAGFKCTVADKEIVGLVKERNQARAEYQEAVSQGQTAGLLEQNVDAADVFTTSIGNVPAGENVLVEITYLGELKNDAETDGVRFTIPTQIAPRYGSPSTSSTSGLPVKASGGIKITVDVQLEDGNTIKGIQSPSHPIAVAMGRTSVQMEDDDSFESHLGSATLTSGDTELGDDFIVIVSAKGMDTPRALLETHPTLPNQRALMTTLVPKFNIPQGHPEIVFVVDRSGSMNGKMHLVIEALRVFLKSLPVSVKFNICSFGSHHDFLFNKSQTYDAGSLQKAMNYIDPKSFTANYGGTEMLRPIEALLEQRYKDLPLEVMLLTDGEIWNQDALFTVINDASQKNARFFTLGIGSSASSALVEGIARAGRGFAQWVNDGERIDKRIVRMLKGALTPHIKYRLEVKYGKLDSEGEDDFEIIDSFEKSMKLIGGNNESSVSKPAAEPKPKKKISLFGETTEEPTSPQAGRYDHLPKVSTPNILQTPQNIPELYPHSRFTVYLLFGPDASDRRPTSITLRGDSEHGELELEIPVQNVAIGDTLHKLAAKKAMQDLEEGRGWISEALTKNGDSIKSQNEGNWDLLVEREAVRLGTTFQVGGKFCSFVAVERNDTGSDKSRTTLTNVQDYQTKSENLNMDQRRLSRMAQTSMMAPRLAMAAPASSGASFGQSMFYRSRTHSSGMTKAKKSSKGGLFGGSLDGSFFSSAAPGGYQPPPPPPPAPSMGQPPLSFSSSAALDESKARGGSAPLGGMAAPVQQNLQGQIGRKQAVDESTGFESSRRMRSTGSALFSKLSAPKNEFGGFGRGAVKKEKSSKSYDPSNDFSVVVPQEIVESLAPLEKMQRLIALQSFSGSWTVSKEFLMVVSNSATTALGGEADVIQLVSGDAMSKLSAGECATILAIAWLEKVMRDEKDVWEMVAEKARGWLEGRVNGNEAVSRLVDNSKRLLKSE